MAQLGRAALEAFFETNDFPTQSEFADLIDSFLNFTDDGSQILETDNITILTADVLTLNATPVEVIPNPGPAIGIDIISAFAALPFNSIPYATNTNLHLTYDITFNHIMEIPGFLAWTNTIQIPFVKFQPAGPAGFQMANNKSVKAFVPGGNPTAGNSPILIFAAYRLVS